MPAPKERTFTLSTEFITLGQLLKAVDAVSSGGEVKDLLATGKIRVNMEIDDRRGRKLYPGDIVTGPGGLRVRIA